MVKRDSVGEFYDNSTLSYVDVAQLRALISAGADVEVLDGKSE